QYVANHPGTLGIEDVQRHWRVRSGCRLQREQADLRAVSMGDHEVVPVCRQFAQRHRGAGYVRPLVPCRHRLPPPEERVSAKGDDDPHGHPPIVATRIALIVCILFSAWSNTTEAGESKTSSSTSMHPMPNSFWMSA